MQVSPIWHERQTMNRQVTFLLGTGRCGSTLTQRILNACPEVIIWGEHAGFLRAVAEGYFQVLTNENMQNTVYQNPGQYSPQTIINNRKYICQSDISWMNNFTEASIKKNFTNLIEATFCDQLPDSIKYWGFKEILYGINSSDRSVDMLLELFPKSRNIIITRHPFNTLVSMLTAWNPHLIDDFAKNDRDNQLKKQLHQLVISRAEKWCSQNAKLLQYSRDFPDNFILVKYENLHKEFIDSIFPFIGIAIPENLESIFERKVWATKNSNRSLISKQIVNSKINQVQQIVGSIAKELNYDIT